MKQTGVILTIASTLVLGLPVVAAAAGDPLAQPNADLAKLEADANAAESTVAADANGSDLAQLARDAKAGSSTLKSDWKLLIVDATAARKAGADKTQLRSLLGVARTRVKAFRSAVRTAFAKARQAAKQNRGAKGAKHGEPSGQGSDEDGSSG
jgi:hypothetical protein